MGGTARADHVVWLDGADPAVAARSGDLVMLYHLLWELTHVVFEHPGLLTPEDECTDSVCVTCSDEGRVAEVRAVLTDGRVEVLAGGRAEQVDGRLVDGLRPGDLVLVHAGVAVTGLVGGARIVSTEPTGFLYPFIEAEERDAGGPRERPRHVGQGQDAAVGLPARRHARPLREQVERAGAAMAERFVRGGRLFTFGNGGSATDAQGTAELFRHPPQRSPLPALSLVDDQAVLTALSNDVGFELVFSRQLIAYAGELDIAVGFSTSGDSADMLRAFEEAARRGLLTVGLCGYEGSGMATSDCRPPLPGRALRERSPDSGGPGRPDARPVGFRPAPPADARRPSAPRDARHERRRTRSGRGQRAGRRPGDREAAVFGRIEAFRRRRPRLRDEVVTLAHGAGGKASAALLDAVFLPAFDPEDADGPSTGPDRRRLGGPPLG